MLIQKAINWLDSEIDVLLNTESEAASIAEVSPQKLVLLDLEATLQKLHCLLASHRDVARNLLITPNPERPNRVPSCYIQSQNQSINQSNHEFTSQDRSRERRQWESLVPLEKTGFWPLSCSNTLAALVRRSPLSPTEMLRTSFCTLISLIGLLSFFSEAFKIQNPKRSEINKSLH